jgi:hypothetical protein
MKRLMAVGLQILLIALLLIYLGDWAVLSLRKGDSSSVQVDQFLRTPLKGQKEEFDYMGTVAQSCVPSLFPHRSETPCWWLKRHKTQWISS